MAKMWHKLGSVVTISLGDLEAMKATSEAFTLRYGFDWVTQDSHVAKEVMTKAFLHARIGQGAS